MDGAFVGIATGSRDASGQQQDHSAPAIPTGRGCPRGSVTAIPRMRGQPWRLPGAPGEEEQGQEEQGDGKEQAWEGQQPRQVGV